MFPEPPVKILLSYRVVQIVINMKKVFLFILYFKCFALTANAQEYLVFSKNKSFSDDYSLLLLRKSGGENFDRKGITMNGITYLPLHLKMTNEEHELFSCCENDTTSYSGMDEYEKNIKKMGESQFENLVAKYRKMIDSACRMMEKKSLTLTFKDRVIQIFDMKVETCDCVYETVKNSQRIYYNFLYLKKVISISYIDAKQKKRLKNQTQNIRNLFFEYNGH